MQIDIYESIKHLPLAHVLSIAIYAANEAAPAEPTPDTRGADVETARPTRAS